MMKGAELAVIGVSALDRLFQGKAVGEMLVFENIRCVGCGESVDIKIEKTSGGYGFLNGIISEPLEGRFLARCCKCNGYKQNRGDWGNPPWRSPAGR